MHLKITINHFVCCVFTEVSTDLKVCFFRELWQNKSVINIKFYFSFVDCLQVINLCLTLYYCLCLSPIKHILLDINCKHHIVHCNPGWKWWDYNPIKSKYIGTSLWGYLRWKMMHINGVWHSLCLTETAINVLILSHTIFKDHVVWIICCNRLDTWESNTNNTLSPASVFHSTLFWCVTLTPSGLRKCSVKQCTPQWCVWKSSRPPLGSIMRRVWLVSCLETGPVLMEAPGSPRPKTRRRPSKLNPPLSHLRVQLCAWLGRSLPWKVWDAVLPV